MNWLSPLLWESRNDLWGKKNEFKIVAWARYSTQPRMHWGGLEVCSAGGGSLSGGGLETAFWEGRCYITQQQLACHPWGWFGGSGCSQSDTCFVQGHSQACLGPRKIIWKGPLSVYWGANSRFRTWPFCTLLLAGLVFLYVNPVPCLN